MNIRLMIGNSKTLLALVLVHVVCSSLATADTEKVKDLYVKVHPVLGVPTFTISRNPQKGYEPFTTPCFETYVPKTEYFKQFAGAGCKLYSFNTNAAACDYGHSKPHWIDVNTWDYSGLEERIRMVLDADPDAMIMPRVNMGTPRWWLDANPDEWEIIDDGSAFYKSPNRNPTLPKDRAFPSLASHKWRHDMGDALKRLIEHIQASDYSHNIFGYFLAGVDTEEWYHWSSGSNQLAGYSTHTRDAFRKWLRDKYIDARTLRTAWSDADIDFDSVEVPSRDERFDEGQGAFRDPSEKMNVIDFYLFYNDLMVDAIEHFAKVARQATCGRKAIGAFYGYMYEFRGDPEYGHNALTKYNKSPYLNFIFVTASYGNRHFGVGGDYSRSPAFSVRLHDKLWYHDNDVVSFVAKKMWEGKDYDQGNLNDVRTWMNSLGYTETPEQSKWMYRRSFGFALCSGAYESYFDLHGGYYDDPQLMAEVKRLNKAAEYTKRYDRSSNSEILIVSDEASCSYATFRSRMLELSLLQTQWELIKIGAPADHVLIDDLDLLGTDQYKLVVFLNNYNMTDCQRQLVDKKLKYGNKWLMWSYAPGLFNEHAGVPESMKGLTGLGIVTDTGNAQSVAPRIEFKAADCSLAKTLASLPLRVVGPDDQCAQLVRVDDKDAVALGTLPGTDYVTFALKDMGSWTSLYAITPTLPASLYREIARAAGVHIYNEHDDTFYANTTFVTIHANGAGPRTIKFPWACDVVNVIDRTPVAVNSEEYTYDFQNGETLILKWRTRL